MSVVKEKERENRGQNNARVRISFFEHLLGSRTLLAALHIFYFIKKKIKTPVIPPLEINHH